MRLKKSIFNALSNTTILILRSVLLFVVRIVFVRTLGKMYLGIDSLFTNIISVLSIVELGIGTAINFSLYKPLHDKDYKKVSQIMGFLRRMYIILGIIVFIIGIGIIPFLHIIVKENITNIYLLYILYLIPTVLSYFISYKESLLNADQNMYKSSIIVGGTYIAMYILRIIFLIIMPNLMIYVIIQLVMIIIQRVLVNIYISKNYSFINFKDKSKLPQQEKKSIFKNVKSMFMHKIGGYLVTGTDSIIISAFPTLGLSLVGIYTNYISITSVIDTMIIRGLSGVTASFGDLSVSESKEVQENVFNIISFISSMIYGIFTLGFIFLLTYFINICFGKNYELPSNLVYIICINFYLVGVLRSLDIIKEATGNYSQDRYAPLIQALINLVLSIVLTKLFGLIGVILGTLISTILVPLWNKPYILYKYLFNKNCLSYFWNQIKYFMFFLFVYFICIIIYRYVCIKNIILLFIIKGIILCTVFIVILLIVFRKNKEFEYLKKVFLKFIGKIIKHNKQNNI